MPHSLVKASPVERFRHRSLETLLTRPVIWCKFTFTMEYHKDNEEKSTHSDSLQRVPVAEKGRADLWGRWSRSRAPSGGLPLGCDGSARHRARVCLHPLRPRPRRERTSQRRSVLALPKAAFVRRRANQGGTTAKFAVLDLCQGRFFCCIARMIPSSGRAG